MKIKDMPDEVKAKIKGFNCKKYRVNRCFRCPLENKFIRCVFAAVTHYDEIANYDVDVEKLIAEGHI